MLYFLNQIKNDYIKHIFSLNFTEAINKLKLSIDKWRVLSLSLIFNIFQWSLNVLGEDISPDLELALFGCSDP